jgi:probable HAF family extracellular repeat protein
MRLRTLSWISAMFLVAALTTPVRTTAQEQTKHQQYRLIAVGTFGGPNSTYLTGPGSGLLGYLNLRGAAVGMASTMETDPFSPQYCWFDCNIEHALKFQDGVLTDLGALPGANSSGANSINDWGLVVGTSETGRTDPVTGSPEYRAVIWLGDSRPIDLGTFGGNESQAFMVNDFGQVVGVAANAIPDPYSSSASAYGLGAYTAWFSGESVATQQRAFLWQGFGLQDLGTLGGNDAVGYLLNNRGQVAGVSYTNTTANATTGFPTQDPFLWQNGRMIDLGTLGGTHGLPYWLNDEGQVVGNSDAAGDQLIRAFLWQDGVMHDLGTLGGNEAGAHWINDCGEVVGAAATTGDVTLHAFLWRHGVMTDLGAPAGYQISSAWGINAWTQVVGVAESDQGAETAFLWENGGPMVNLNALVESNPSGLQLEDALTISDGGEIVALGQLPSGDYRLALLIPDGECSAACQSRVAASESKTAERQGEMAHGQSAETLNQSREMRGGSARSVLGRPLL